MKPQLSEIPMTTLLKLGCMVFCAFGVICVCFMFALGAKVALIMGAIAFMVGGALAFKD